MSAVPGGDETGTAAVDEEGTPVALESGGASDEDVVPDDELVSGG